MQVRTVPAGRPEDFACPIPGFVACSAELTRLWEQGRSRPQWCFLAELGGHAVARLGFAVGHDPHEVAESRHPDVDLLSATLRRIPPEVSIFALDYLTGHAELAGRLLRAALGRLRLPPGTVVEARVNRETDADVADRRRILAAGGLSLFQEKQGYAWSADWSSPPSPPPHGLRLTPVSECGLEPFLAVMGRAVADTLDRNDRYYYALCGARGWARVMAEYLEPDAESTWCLAADEHGESVGFVAVSAFPEPATATVTHVGVLAEHRGRGHGRRLVAAGMVLAAEAGYTAMINEVDVEPEPSATVTKSLVLR
jgi:GNAT superfamily N-acetyltransferase